MALSRTPSRSPAAPQAPAARAPAPRPPARPGAAAAGFTFLELIVIMGILAMLMGLTVGYIRSAGRVNALGMARSQILDAAYRAQGMSAGEKIGMLTFRPGTDENGRETLEVLTSVAETLVTHAFETLDGASLNLPLKVLGPLQRVESGGRPGACAQFGRGASVAFDPQARFAATDGLDVEAWVAPEAGAPVMVLVEGQGAYELSLVRGGGAGDYGLRLRLFLRPEDDALEPSWVPFETEGQPVKANGRWTHVHASFDGVEASLRIDGLERARRAPAPAGGAARAARPRRIGVPPGGAVALSLGSGSQPYTGRMDSVVVRGVFRLADERSRLPEGLVADVASPPKQALPYRVTWRNGRLDPDRHAEDVLVRLSDPQRLQDPPLEVRFSRHGVISADLSHSTPAPAAGEPGPGRATTPGEGGR